MITPQAGGFGLDARLPKDRLTSSVAMHQREAAFFSCRSAEGLWQLHLRAHEYFAQCFSPFLSSSVVMCELSECSDLPDSGL